MICSFKLIQIRKRTHNNQDPISLMKFGYRFNHLWLKHQLNFLMTDQKCSTCGAGPFKEFIERDHHKSKVHHEVVVR